MIRTSTWVSLIISSVYTAADKYFAAFIFLALSAYCLWEDIKQYRKEK